MYYLSRFINLLTSVDDYVIVAGDLNTESYEIGFNYLLKSCQLIDSYNKFFDECDEIYTCNDYKNKYSSNRDVPRRIDYILHSRNFESKSYEIILKQIPSSNMSYSDHYGVHVELALICDINDLQKSQIFKLNKDDFSELKKQFLIGKSESCFNFFSCLFYFISFVIIGLSLQCFIDAFGFNLPFLNYSKVIILFCFFLGSIISFISLRCQSRVYKGALMELENQLEQFL